ncbi:ABC transporter permease [Arthrobacter sp. MYb227]|uniref:ABC transporter permease n=1 Tax=Arthrobacter sp. MYb227 TaxID=1848601 RepID=UPI0011B0ACBC|nr:ABC transporter permease [Arthrobacter sp. MYb227]
MMDPISIPALVFVLVLVAYGSFSTSSFLNGFNISNVLVQVTPLLLIALGQSFAVGTGGLDLSVGSTASLTAVVAATLFVPLGAPLALLVAIGAALLVGLINGLLVASGLEAFLVTLASMAVVQGIALLIQPVPGGEVPKAYAKLAGLWGNIPVALPFVLAVVVLAALLLRKTSLGTNILSVGGDVHVARLVGIRVERTLVQAYVLSAFFAGLAGLFLAARTRTGDPTIGASFTLDSLAAVVVGGTLLTGGRITMAGTVLGSLALGLLPNVMNLSGVSTFFQTTAKGLILLIAILLPVLISRSIARRRRAQEGNMLRSRIPTGKEEDAARSGPMISV